METLVRAAGILAALMALGGAWTVRRLLLRPPAGLPMGLHMPALAIEFLDDAAAVEGFLGARGGPDDRRPALRAGVRADYVFIVMYWLLFAWLVVLLASRGEGWGWPVLAAAAGLCATGAAAFDLAENSRITALLDAPAVGRALVDRLTFACRAKWILFALTTLLLSPLFLRRDWLALLVPVYVVVGALCLAGVLGRKPVLVEFAFLLTLAALVPLAVVFTAWPKWVVDGL